MQVHTLLGLFGGGLFPLIAEAAWFNPMNGHWYELTPTVMSWNQAEEYATAQGKHLAALSTAEEAEWVLANIPLPQVGSPGGFDPSIWLGASDRAVEGRWQWTNGETWGYTRWMLGEPNDNPVGGPFGEDYLVMSVTQGTRGGWNDADAEFFGSNPLRLYGLIEWSGPPPAAQWTARSLHFAGYTSYAADVQDGQVTGSHRLAFSYTRPFVYSIASDTWVDITPAGAGGTGAQAYGCGGGQQVGYTDRNSYHAASMWRGTPESWIDLRPTGGHGIVYGTDGFQQVGHMDAANGGRAGLWTGSAASFASLHPAGAAVSYAYGVGSGEQVGVVRSSIGSPDRACLWRGTPESWVSLHPADATTSVARGAHSGRQIGDVVIGGVTRASLWAGSAASRVDLHPPGATSSNGGNLFGELQAGTAMFADGRRHAGLWRGTAESWQDLSQYIPAGYTHSGASSVWYNDVATYVSGTATNAAGWDEAFLWIGPPPGPCFNLASPTDSTACPGATVTLSVAPRGSGPFTYRWRHDGIPIDAATNPTAGSGELRLVDLSAADTGSYDCVVTNSCATVISRNALVTFSGTATAVTVEPADQLLNAGQSAAFSCSAAGSELAFQWRRDGVVLSDDDRISGARTAALSIGGVRWNDQGGYDCIVTGECGTALTRSAVLVVPACNPIWAHNEDWSPGPRWVHAQAFDFASGGMLVFGGRDAAGGVLGDTWLRSAGEWYPAAPGGPAPRSDHAMASIGSSGIVLFGGITSALAASALGDTWRWNGSQWSMIEVSGPPARGGHKMAFDSGRGRAVLFGGFDRNGAVLGDTWEWDGSRWTRVSQIGPSPRFAHAMAYDPILGKVILFGGFNGTALVGDTWLWDGVQWTNVAATGPSSRIYSEADFDPLLGQFVLFGGTIGGSSVLNDSWMWNGSGWQPRTFGNPPDPKWTHAMSFDYAEQRMLVSGGAGVGSVRFDDAWELSGSPVITGQPSDREVRSPDPLILEVHAAGNGPLTYQWRRNGTDVLNGGRISGARTSRLTIQSAEPSDSAEYQVIVRNACSTQASRVADVNVWCLADFNRDGGIDGADVEAFFADWEAGAAASDVNQDGGIDGMDVEMFFARWEGGC